MNCSLCFSKCKKKNKLLYICVKCKLVHFIKAKSFVYEKQYFEDEYKIQYGKTYIEDKANLQIRAKERLRKFKENINYAPNMALLEIGSAAGFFLEKAKDEGFSVEGWEISKKMAQVANKNGIKTKTGDWKSLYQKWNKEQNKKYDILCAFYFLEHIEEQNLIWSLFKEMIKPGGFLMLAMPSIYGPSYYFEFNNWLKFHPKDHFVDYSPKTLKNAAKLFSFNVIMTSYEGIHPERFPLGKNIVLSKIYQFIQKKMKFSDTMFTILKKEERHD
ncbi:MAG: class I SAM-dependent methyltransferase [Spirochaetia bacterium]|nr:class I SAM-dependent methyltransferase [Spirochaetia bacterium]